MLYTLLSIFIMLVLLDKSTRTGKTEVTQLEAKFRVFALRDKLRRMAIDGQVSPTNPWFDLMDSALTRLAQSIGVVTIWGGLALLWSHRKDREKLRQSLRITERALAKPENNALLPIYHEYIAVIAFFLFERHKPLINVSSRITVSYWGLKRFFAGIWIEVFTSAPETSTLHRSPQVVSMHESPQLAGVSN